MRVRSEAKSRARPRARPKRKAGGKARGTAKGTAEGKDRGREKNKNKDRPRPWLKLETQDKTEVKKGKYGSSMEFPKAYQQQHQDPVFQNSEPVELFSYWVRL